MAGGRGGAGGMEKKGGQSRWCRRSERLIGTRERENNLRVRDGSTGGVMGAGGGGGGGGSLICDLVARVCRLTRGPRERCIYIDGFLPTPQ